MILARGVYSDYDVKTVREAIEQMHWDEANAEMERVANVLDGERARMCWKTHSPVLCLLVG